MKKFIDERLEEILIVITMALMVLLIFYQVVSRYVFNDSMSWTEELARYVHIWQVWIAASFAVRKGKHIKVEMFKDLLPPLFRKIIDFIALGLWFFVAVTLAYVGSEVILSLIEQGQVSPAMRVPMWWAYLAIPVGGLLMSIRLIQQFIFLIKNPDREYSSSEGEPL
ncbi:TRAP transporter small permease [Halobacillus sp. HZG1]|uniref:TRAP transporter small permease n=1 Tax=Halobacillus sp. HZG1 TaxID=3111769 RepID=UPI002DB9AEED|nr:TRAP transporter small permease [Halobacillus sp. HZG1]MEC3883993.1 TRAP transporter small permease [Halobacillus sp. HZG1]